MPSCDAFGVAVEVALPHVLELCDGLSLCAVLGVSSYWRRTFCCVNAPGQKLFQAACVQQWPWLQTSLSWSNSTHHLWQHYLGSWQALCCDKNRANSIYSFELDVPCNVAVPCIQSAWVNIPERELQVRVNVYPKGNRRMTTSHLSVYLEVQALAQKKSGMLLLILHLMFIIQHIRLGRFHGLLAQCGFAPTLLVVVVWIGAVMSCFQVMRWAWAVNRRQQLPRSKLLFQFKRHC